MRHARAGNTLDYEADGRGGRTRRSLTWDRENRPATITDDNGSAITFLYWPDGTRAAKFGVVPTWYFGGDVAETADSLAVNASTTLTVHHAGQLQEEISATGSRLIFRAQDGQGSTRMSLAETGTLTTRHDFGPYGAPRQANGAVVTNGKGWINERNDAVERCCPIPTVWCKCSTSWHIGTSIHDHAPQLNSGSNEQDN